MFLNNVGRMYTHSCRLRPLRRPPPSLPSLLLLPPSPSLTATTLVAVAISLYVARHPHRRHHRPCVPCPFRRCPHRSRPTRSPIDRLIVESADTLTTVLSLRQRHHTTNPPCTNIGLRRRHPTVFGMSMTSPSRRRRRRKRRRRPIPRFILTTFSGASPLLTPRGGGWGCTLQMRSRSMDPFFVRICEAGPL